MVCIISSVVLWYTVCLFSLIPGIITWHKNLPCKAETTGKVTAIRTVTGWGKSLGDKKKHRTTYHLLVVEFKDRDGNTRTVLSSNNCSNNHRVGELCKVRYCDGDPTHAYLVEPNMAIIVGVLLALVPVVIAILFWFIYSISYV